MRQPVRLGLAALCALVIAFLLGAWTLARRSAPTPVTAQQNAGAAAPSSVLGADRSATTIHAHNLILRKGPDFRIYVRWLDGALARTRRNVDPSFDRPESFDLNINSGVIRANIGDVGHYLNGSLADSPLSNVSLVADGPNLKLTGIVHKVVPLPVQVIASVSAAPNDQIRLHINKIDVLKVPVKGLLRIFHITPADLMKTDVPGIHMEGSDFLLDTHTLFPPPHISGQLTNVSVESPDIQVMYGNAEKEVERVEEWRNFFSLRGGTIDFGSLTMHPVNIFIIDISSNPWFDLDLVNYRAQFSSGYTRMTADSALQIFIPDRRDVPQKPVAQDSIQWFKDRNIPPPPTLVRAQASPQPRNSRTQVQPQQP